MPIVVNRDVEAAKEIANIIKEIGCEIISYWVLLSDPNEKLTEWDVFKRDTEGVRRCDAFVAEVSKPSHGVGMEIMLAHMLKKAIICIYKKGTRLSWMIKGLPNAKLIEYETIDNLKNKLIKMLSC